MQGQIEARFIELEQAMALLPSTYQPLDSDLTAIAALSTTAYGRALLTLANQAALTALISSATETASGIVELATNAETTTGTDMTRATHPAGVAAAISAASAAYQPVDSDLTAIAALTTTAYGRNFLTLADQAALVALLPSYQPLDSDLTAIAALTTTSYGRAVLELADAAALRSHAALGTIATQAANNVAITGGSITGITDLAVADGGTGASTAAGAMTNLGAGRTINTTAPLTGGGTLAADRTLAVSAASETATGVVELATSAEVETGTDAVRTVTPATLSARYPKKSLLTTKGDLIVATASATPARIAVGANGTIPMADSSATEGLRYVSHRAGFKNLLHNGCGEVAQRGTSQTGITTDGRYTADRWYTRVVTAGTWTMTVEDSTVFPNAPSRKSIKMLCTAADAALAAGDEVRLWQIIEGNELQRVMKGKAGAQTLTLSFWALSNISGTFCCTAYDNNNNRLWSNSYALVANTPTKVALTIPADATGQFTADSNGSLYINFWLAAGSNATSGTLQTSWGTLVSANQAVGQTNLAAAVNNYFQMTAVQLEVGSVATEYDVRPYAEELRLCQRYYQRLGGASHSTWGHGYASATTTVEIYIPLCVPLRTSPSGISWGSGVNMRLSDGPNAHTSISAIGVNAARTRPELICVDVTHGFATLVQFRPYAWQSNADATNFIAFSVDL